jgi:mRNA-degrading endonuclease RelE of RelBE toxin-antitoxin system
MVYVSLSPEGLTSLRRLPIDTRNSYDRLLMQIRATSRLRLPGEFDTHPLEGGLKLWTLKVGPYRGIFRWDGHELRFIRFGHRSVVYQRLPK